MLRILFSSLLAAFLSSQAAATVSIEIDLQEQRAYLIRNHRTVLETPISTGRSGHRTPTGKFKITEKDHNHRSSEYGRIVDGRGRTIIADADAGMKIPKGGKFIAAPMPYFLRFTGGIGMHAGHLPGYPASHGCVRMPKSKAAAFYEAVKVGSPVTVFGRTGNERSQEMRDYERLNDGQSEIEYYERPVYERRVYQRRFFRRPSSGW